MNVYLEMKRNHEKEFNEFPMVFAFSDKQFKEGMIKLGLDPSETEKVFSTNAGGFYLKTDSPKLKKMLNNHKVEMDIAKKDDTFLFEMFDYELSNHEYCYTGDFSDTIDALGYTLDEVLTSEKLKSALTKAIKVQSEDR